LISLCNNHYPFIFKHYPYMKKIFFLVFPVLLLSACTAKEKITPSSSPVTNTVISSDANTIKTPVSSKPSRTIPTPSLGTGTTKVEMFIDYQCEACQAFSKSL
jgi:uncharacterized lipoprotein YajG